MHRILAILAAWIALGFTAFDSHPNSIGAARVAAARGPRIMGALDLRSR